MELVRKYFESLKISEWKLGLLDGRHLLIQLTKEDDYARIFAKQSIIIAGTEMKILKWSPDYDPSREPPTVPIWFKLPKLPSHLFKLNALFIIGCTLGTPLKVDAATFNKARPASARVLVERDVTLPDVKRIWIGDNHRGFWQEVIIEQRPHYCQHCKMFGHNMERCYRLKPPIRRTHQQPQQELEDANINIQEVGNIEVQKKTLIAEGTDESLTQKDSPCVAGTVRIGSKVAGQISIKAKKLEIQPEAESVGEELLTSPSPKNVKNPVVDLAVELSSQKLVEDMNKELESD
ncbi:uncharacterized protein LOC110038381 [Phalaenopsis equestris]|uniref:uncharacterized protein LOC110038381 n=1 Tax=Phalaenopsis equestris TaxID=78828 RepID=UPI0009E3D964|nr:uncharacterized protein LOC110038381 [Phalaenopsis equestris]